MMTWNPLSPVKSERCVSSVSSFLGLVASQFSRSGKLSLLQ